MRKNGLLQRFKQMRGERIGRHSNISSYCHYVQIFKGKYEYFKNHNIKYKKTPVNRAEVSK